MKTPFAKFLALYFVAFSSWGIGEVQLSVNLSAPKLFTGSTGPFTISQSSGNPSVASGTIARTYSGVTQFSLTSATGRYLGQTGTSVYGMELGPIYAFRDMVTGRYLTVVNSASECPSVGTYNWLGVRFRTPGAPRLPENASSTSFMAGGTLVYDPSATHIVTGNSIFDLVGPTLNGSANYYFDSLGGAACNDGWLKLLASGTQSPFDSAGLMYFGDNSLVYVSSGGNPKVQYGVLQQTLSAPTLAALSNSVFSGLYTSYDATTSQTQNNIYFYPDSAGTTYTLYTAINLNDGSQKTLFGTLACTAVNSPANGFCSGSLTLNGVTGTGKAVCLISTLTMEKNIACVAQRPDNNSLPVTLIGAIPSKSVLALSGPVTAVSALPAGTTTFAVTVKNLTGRAVSTMGNPASGALRLAAPFSNSGAFAGTGGTCGATLGGFQSCTITITFSPSAYGSFSQTFRVAYDDGYFGTINATLPVLATSGLVSMAVTPSTGSFTAGSTVQYVATATYLNSSTQNVTSLVNWSSNNSTAVNLTKQGIATYLASGSATLSASFASITGTQNVSTGAGTTLNTLGQISPTAFAGSTTGLNGARGMFIGNGRFYLADTFNNRVLIWDAIPTSNQTPPDRVLGQQDFAGNTANAGGISSRALNQPFAMASDGTRVVISDTYNHRILIYNSMPLSNFAAADLVLGQPDFVSSTANNGGVSASRMNYPLGVALTGGKLLVADFGNHRVLIWNTFPTTNGQAADLVLGQPNMTANTLNNGGVSAQSMQYPYGCYTDGTRIFVADSYNNRVLQWNTIPTVNRQAANIVLGQPNMTSNTANNGGVTAQALNMPMQISSTGTQLLVSDQNNNRILLWTSIPSVNRQAANLVFGQPNMTSSTANNGGVTSQSMSAPYGVYLDSTRMMVADVNNNRVLFWTPVPSANYASAAYVFGQNSFTSSGANGSDNASASSMNAPNQVFTDGTRVVVADSVNNRVLLWTSLPTTDGQNADLVLGQPDMTSNSVATVSASTLNNPKSAILVGTKLIVADSGNNRVLIWNSIPSANGQAANVVIGQPNLTGSLANNGGVSSSRLSNPYAVASDGTILFIADYANNRVLRYATIPVANNVAANNVLGQANFTGVTANSGGIAAGTMSGPGALSVAGGKLILGDILNSRVLIWNTLPTTNQKTADLELGQANMTSNTFNSGGVTATSLSYPAGVFSDGTRLFVADQSNNRILGWTTFPTANRQAATRVIGQANFTASTANSNGLSSTSVNSPSGIYIDSADAWVADTNNYRVLITPINAQLQISDTPSYDFGSLILNTSATRTFVVTNGGSGSATAMAAGTPALGAPFGFVGGSYPGTSGTCGTTLAPQSSCTLSVLFNPTTEAASFADVVRISYNDGVNTQAAVVGVTGQSVLQASLTFVNGATYAFGTHVVGSVTNGTITVSNASGVVASVMEESSASPIASPFVFKGGWYPGIGGTCASYLATGSTCTLVVTFAPTAVTSSSDVLTLNYYNGNATTSASTNLTGTGN